MPSELPEHFEAGTLPTPAIAALGAGIKYINKVGIDNIERKIAHLTEYLSGELERMRGIEIFGRKNGIVSFRHNDVYLGDLLNRGGIATRSGLHCAPSAHNKLGTAQTGLTRVSFSYFNSEWDIDSMLCVLRASL